MESKIRKRRSFDSQRSLRMTSKTNTKTNAGPSTALHSAQDDNEKLLAGGGAGVVVLIAGDVFSGDGDAQLAEEAEIVLREGLVDVASGGDFDLSVLLGGEIVECDGGFEHEQDIEAVLADVLYDTGDLLVLDDRLVDGLSQLLNEFAQTSCHRCLQGCGRRGGCGAAAWDSSTLLPLRPGSK